MVISEKMKDKDNHKKYDKLMKKEDMFVWRPSIMIKPGETCTISLTEKKDEFNRTVVIENGHVTKKPDDIDILGVNTPFGFEVRGLRKRQESQIEKISVTKAKSGG